MIDEAYLKDFIQTEMSFYAELHPPWKERFLCWLLRLRPRHEVIMEELEMLDCYVTALSHRKNQPVCSNEGGCTCSHDYEITPPTQYNDYKRYGGGP